MDAIEQGFSGHTYTIVTFPALEEMWVELSANPAPLCTVWLLPKARVWGRLGAIGCGLLSAICRPSVCLSVGSFWEGEGSSCLCCSVVAPPGEGLVDWGESRGGLERPENSRTSVNRKPDG